MGFVDCRRDPRVRGRRLKRKKKKTTGYLDPSNFSALTDTGNAERLVEYFGDEFRYVRKWELFIVWTGKYWEVDIGNIRMGQLAKRVSAKIEEERRQIRPSRRTEHRKWFKKSQSGTQRREMINLVKSEKGVAIEHDELDQRPYLFNVQNGTIDLKTGELREHRRGDYITKIAPISYDPEAECPTWRKFLRKAMAGDMELVRYLKRHSGFALTGSTKDHVLVFHYGDGNNGKSTFLTTLHAVFGEYGTRASRGLLFKTRNERHATSLATLHGKRFVSCPEVEQDQELDEALVKDLTGGDPINCRRMREDEWVFYPVHKLLLAGNYKPRIKGTDRGIWRRVHLVPWDVIVPDSEIDTELPEKLKKELPGVLRWCVEGCLAWQEKGLAVPEKVVAATAAYRHEQDVLGQFFEEELVFEVDGRVGRATLRQHYETWCEELGHYPVGARKLAEALRRKKVVECNVRLNEKYINGWAGVRFKRAGEKIAEHTHEQRVRAEDKARAKWKMGREKVVSVEKVSPERG